MPGHDQPPAVFSPPPSSHASGALVCVVGASGAVGASSVAAAVAQQVNDMTGSCVLAEWDCGGGGIEVLLALEAEAGARWPQFHSARGLVDGRGLVAALPRWRDLPVLSSSREAPLSVDGQVMSDVFAGLVQAGYVVVVDMPAGALALLGQASSRNVGAAVAEPMSLVQVGQFTAGESVQSRSGQASALDLSSIAAVLVVAATSVQSAAGAMAVTRLVSRLAPHAAVAAVARVLPRSATLDVDLADLTGLDLVGLLREDRGSAQGVERGEGPRLGRSTPLSRAGAQLVDWLGDVL